MRVFVRNRKLGGLFSLLSALVLRFWRQRQRCWAKFRPEPFWA